MNFSRSDVELACLQWAKDNDDEDFFNEISYKKVINLPEIGEASFVDQQRPDTSWDDDHDGEYIDVVFQVGGRYFRKSGTYSSWDADEWDGPFEEVIKAEVRRSEWVNVNKRN